MEKVKGTVMQKTEKVKGTVMQKTEKVKGAVMQKTEKVKGTVIFDGDLPAISRPSWDFPAPSWDVPLLPGDESALHPLSRSGADTSQGSEPWETITTPGFSHSISVSWDT